MAAIALMAAACVDGDELLCGEGQTFASVNSGPEQCYDQCVDGACAAGFACRSGLCVGQTVPNNNNPPNNTNNNPPNNTNNTPPNNTNNTPPNNTNNTNNTPPNNTNNMCATPVNLGVCEPLCQTGCADSETCAIGRSGPNAPLEAACAPAGAVAAGGTCDAMNACGVGTVCIAEAAGDTSGTCLEICDPADPACSTAGATCAAQNQEMTVGFCIVPEDACDPLNDTCPDGEACALTNLGLQCFPSGGGQAGESCDTSNTSMTPCDKGLVCAGTSPADATCLVLCDPTNDTCADGMCQSEAIPDDPGLGVCG